MGKEQMTLLISITPIIKTIVTALSIQASTDIIRCIKNEAGWILTNIAHEVDAGLDFLFTDQSCNFVPVVKQILADAKNPDLVMIDQILFFLGNMTGESAEMRELVRQNLDLPRIIADLLENA